jgi:hypothetical protein
MPLTGMGENSGAGFDMKEFLVTTLGVNPLTILLAFAALGVVLANAAWGPGWLRPLLGLPATEFTRRNLILPLDQEGFLFPPSYVPEDF